MIGVSERNNIMKEKFKAISQFIDKLEKNNFINEQEETLLLVGGEGRALKTNSYCDNGPCMNYSCENSYCTNGGSCHNDDCDNTFCDGSWFN